MFAREGRAAESVTAAEAALALEPRIERRIARWAWCKAAVAGDPSVRIRRRQSLRRRR